MSNTPTTGRASLLAGLRAAFRGREAREAVDTVLQLPEAQAALARVEAEHLAERAALVARMAALPERAAEETRAAAAALAKADAELSAAIDAVGRAKDARMAAFGLYTSISCRLDRERGRLELDLRAGADPRLAQAIEILWHVRNRVGNLTTIGLQASDIPAKPKLVTNGAQVREAVEAIATAMQRIAALQLSACDYPTVTTTLREAAAQLPPLLWRIGCSETLEVCDDGSVRLGGAAGAVALQVH